MPDKMRFPRASEGRLHRLFFSLPGWQSQGLNIELYVYVSVCYCGRRRRRRQRLTPEYQKCIPP